MEATIKLDQVTLKRIVREYIEREHPGALVLSVKSDITVKSRVNALWGRTTDATLDSFVVQVSLPTVTK